VLFALLPALAASVASGSTCVAMAGAGQTTVAQQAATPPAHAPHSHHVTADHASDAATPSTTPCPHCPLMSGAANAAAANCTLAATQADVAASAFASFADLVQAPPPLWISPSAGAIPPLIGRPPSFTAPPPSRLPLSIRHCVWLI
jgi:hypothetical protein